MSRNSRRSFLTGAAVVVQDFRIGQEKPKSGFCDNFDGEPANQKYSDGMNFMRLNARNRSDSTAWTDPSLEKLTTNTLRNSRSTLQFYNGKVPSILNARDCESNGNCILAARLKANDFFLDSEIDIHGNSSTKRLMWTILIVPVDIERNLHSDTILTQRNENTSGTFVFYGPHQSFNNGDASILANSAKALFDVPRFRTAPNSEISRYKLTSLVGNEMSGRSSHRMNGVGHEGYNFIRGRLLLEDSEANDRTGEMVNHYNDPPTERPNLRQAKWPPWNPETGCRDSGHVNMPDVIGVSCGDDSDYLFRFDDFGIGHVVERFFFYDAADGGGSEMQSCSRQYLNDSHLAHGWAKRFEPLDNIADIVGVLVHGLGKLEQPILSIGCSLHPAGNGFGLDHEGSGGFSVIPGTSGLEFQDGHSLLGRVLGALSGEKFGHACIFDSEFFLQQGIFVLNAVEFSSKTDSFDATIDGEAPGVGDYTVGQGDAVDGRQFDILGPILWKRNTLKWALIAHTMVSEDSWDECELRVA